MLLLAVVVVVVCPRVGSQHCVCCDCTVCGHCHNCYTCLSPIAMLPANPQRLNCRSGRKKERKTSPYALVKVAALDAAATAWKCAKKKTKIVELTNDRVACFTSSSQKRAALCSLSLFFSFCLPFFFLFLFSANHCWRARYTLFLAASDAIEIWQREIVVVSG